MRKGTISVCLATFNEEKNLADCLKSVREFVDEIVVVDGLSKDKTVEVAKKFGAKVIVTDNSPMFHINKNKAIRACTGEWVLQLDADERVPKELASELLDIAKKGSSYDGFWLKRRNYFLGRFMKKTGMYPDPVIRFFKNGKGILPEVSVHEQVKIDGEVGWLKNDLIHLADPSFSRYLVRSNRYTSLAAKDLLKVDPGINILSMFQYIFFKPLIRFCSLYIRHKGFTDGFPGFVFSLFSSLHITISYIKYWEAKKTGKDPTLDWS